MSTTNTYLFKALDAYPYNLEETMEALHYALSYDDKNVNALCLLGQVYAEILHDYPTAISYYQEAFVESPENINLYKHYIDVLIKNGDYKNALSVIVYALRLKAINKAIIYIKKAQVYEHQGNYSLAINQLKTAKNYGFDNETLSEIKNEKDRIKAKIPKKKKRKSKKKKA